MSEDCLNYPRVLCVDDEPNVLAGLERTLYEKYEVTTAVSGAAGLDILEREGPFAVVISDMRMPEMDGAAFLSQVRQQAPDTVRMLLTGFTELDGAIAAVNEGNIFRFLCKPCPTEVLLTSLDSAVEQYRLVTAERDLLENTLNGAVKVLSNVLGLASPEAFSRSGQVKSYVKRMVKALNVSDPWQYEIAAMLSQVGCITLPPDILHAIYAGVKVSEEQQKIYNSHPEIGFRLLVQIPRMDKVAQIIRCQRGNKVIEDKEVMLGSEMLRVALAMDHLVSSGASEERAHAALQKKGEYRNDLLNALVDVGTNGSNLAVTSLPVTKLREGMVLQNNILSLEGAVILGKETQLNIAQIERLINFSRGVGIAEPIVVRAPIELFESKF